MVTPRFLMLLALWEISLYQWLGEPFACEFQPKDCNIIPYEKVLPGSENAGVESNRLRMVKRSKPFLYVKFTLFLRNIYILYIIPYKCGVTEWVF